MTEQFIINVHINFEKKEAITKKYTHNNFKKNMLLKQMNIVFLLTILLIYST